MHVSFKVGTLIPKHNKKNQVWWLTPGLQRRLCWRRLRKTSMPRSGRVCSSTASLMAIHDQRLNGIETAYRYHWRRVTNIRWPAQGRSSYWMWTDEMMASMSASQRISPEVCGPSRDSPSVVNTYTEICLDRLSVWLTVIGGWDTYVVCSSRLEVHAFEQPSHQPDRVGVGAARQRGHQHDAARPPRYAPPPDNWRPAPSVPVPTIECRQHLSSCWGLRTYSRNTLRRGARWIQVQYYKSER